MFFLENWDKGFFKKLIRFYQPSQHEFIDIAWKPENFIYAKIGYALISFLLKNSRGFKLLSESNAENYFVVNKSFVAELQYLIENDLKHLKTYRKQFNESLVNESDLNVSLAVEEKVLCNFESFNNTMLREYFSWIGLFTNTKKGVELLTEHKIFILLKKYISKTGFRDHILRVILLCANYTVNSAPRDLLG